MSEAKLQAGRELINEGRYEEARALLRGVDDPEARALLAGLDAQDERETRFTAIEEQRRALEPEPEKSLIHRTLEVIRRLLRQ